MKRPPSFEQNIFFFRKAFADEAEKREREREKESEERFCFFPFISTMLLRNFTSSSSSSSCSSKHFQQTFLLNVKERAGRQVVFSEGKKKIKQQQRRRRSVSLSANVPRKTAFSSSDDPSGPSGPSVSSSLSEKIGIIKSKSSMKSSRDEAFPFQRRDLVMLRRANLLSTSTHGVVAPFPFSGCVLVSAKNAVVAETFQYASGTEPAELQAIDLAGEEKCKGATLYLNMEPGCSLGGDYLVNAIVASKVKRVVIGMKNPLPHLRDKAIQAMIEAGVQVDCLSAFLLDSVNCEEDEEVDTGVETIDDLRGDALRTLKGCFDANENILHHVAKNRPLSVLKYAMTFDGKTASVSGHSAWISGTQSRKLVYLQRCLCDCVVVGGETVRADNPNLTTRKTEGHVPTRVVISRNMNLPLDYNLWDTKVAPSLVITEEGKNRSVQAKLRKKGVEVVEFKDLSLSKVADHLYDRGYMRVLWECGGTLAAPAVQEGVINKVMAFVAPKIIGGSAAPSPVGELGLEKMTDALDVTDVTYEQVDKDVLAVGFLPSSKSIFHVAKEAYKKEKTNRSVISSTDSEEEDLVQIKFYKAWNEYGLLSNFSCIPLTIDGKEWRSVEHYYQAMKFSGVTSVEASYIMDDIASQQSAEEAARIGRRYQSLQPNLLRQDWGQVKIDVMRKALQVKFCVGSSAWHLLQSTCRAEDLPCQLIEYSPRDSFWGYGFDGKGENWLGYLLMEIRDTTNLRNENFEERGDP